MSTRLDLNSERVVFRRIRGRVIPVRINPVERVKNALKSSIVPGVVAATLGEGLAGALAHKAGTGKLFSVKGMAEHFTKLATLKRVGKVAALAVGFSVGYSLLFGKRQKHVIQLDKELKPKARIWLGSKPGFLPGHNLGEHSYLHVRDKKGNTATFGGQIKNALKYGRSGVKLVKNHPTDKMRWAHNVHDLTPSGKKAADNAVARVLREADTLKAQLKDKDYQYRSIPIAPGKVNSNTVTGTLLRRSGLTFRYDQRRHNMPGFQRTIPR